MRRNMVTVSVLVGILAGAAAGDKLTLPGNLSVPIDKVIGFKDGEVVYTTASGANKTRDLKSIVQISIDGQEVFNQAEQLRVEKKGDDAAASYDGTIASGETPAWLAQLARYRKVEVLGKDRSIALAVSTWLEIVATDESPNAVMLLPRDLPGKGDERNAQAITALKTRMGEIKSNLARQEARKLLTAIYRLEGKDDEADKVAGQLTGGSPRTGPDGIPDKAVVGTDAAPPAAGGAQGDARPASSMTGVAGVIRPGQKPSVLAEQVKRLEGDLPKYIAAELGPAMVLIGKGKLYQALQEKSEDARKTLLEQAGLTLMRAKTASTKAATAAEALFYAGQVNEQLGNTQAAENAYKKVLADYKAVKDIAAEAKLALEKLSQKKPG